jgi:hypothetical protein
MTTARALQPARRLHHPHHCCGTPFKEHREGSSIGRIATQIVSAFGIAVNSIAAGVVNLQLGIMTKRLVCHPLTSIAFSPRIVTWSSISAQTVLDLCVLVFLWAAAVRRAMRRALVVGDWHWLRRFFAAGMAWWSRRGGWLVLRVRDR